MVFELCVELIYSGLYVNDSKLVHLVVCIHTLVFDGFYESMILYFGWFLEFYVGFRFVILLVECYDPSELSVCDSLA